MDETRRVWNDVRVVRVVRVPVIGAVHFDSLPLLLLLLLVVVVVVVARASGIEK